VYLVEVWRWGRQLSTLCLRQLLLDYARSLIGGAAS
jgi:hypothetical protein